MTVRTERLGHVLVVTLDRPEARNAVDEDMATELGRVFAGAEADTGVRVVVLTGAGGRSFCAGADLKALAAGRPPFSREHPEWGLAGVVAHPLTVPVIAAVDGTALGGGLEIALACDLVVASETSVFGLPEVRRGLYAGAGGVFRLPEVVPRRVAMEMMLTGEPVDAARALELGLVNRVVPAGRLVDEALRLAETIAANAPLAVRASKRVALGVEGSGPEASRPAEAARWRLNDAVFPVLMTSEDAQEGPRAFAEKRDPVWRGR